MFKSIVKLVLPALMVAGTALAAEATVQVGTAIEKYEVTGQATSFTVAPDTKIYAGLKVSGIENKTVTVAFWKNGKQSSQIELKVPRSPYRTHAYSPARAGDSGAWTVKVLGPDGAVLATSDFQVKVTGS